MRAALLLALLALVLALLALVPAARAQTGPFCDGGRQVTAEDLRAHGAGRLGDAVRLLAPVRAWTVDGFDAEPRNARGAITLVLDGVPWQGTSTVEPGMLDALPVAVSEVESIAYCPGSTMIAGRIVGSTLHVWTRPPERVAALADYGNETGDPGPARYLDPGLPNSDHWGPDGELVARSGRAWATLRARSFLPTDTAIVARTSAASARFPEHQTLLGAITARSPNGASQGRVAAFTSGELPFLPRAEREVAVRRRWAHGVARWARHPRAPQFQARGGVRALSAPVWAAPDSVVARVSDWREAFAAGSASLAHSDGVRVGARGDVMQARGDERLPDFDAPIQQESAIAATAGLWASFRSPRHDGLPDVTADGFLATRADGGIQPGGGVSVSGSRDCVSLVLCPSWSVTVRRTPAAAAPDAGYWRAAGLAPLVRDGGTGADIATDEVSILISSRPPYTHTARRTEAGWTLLGGWTRSPEPVASQRDGSPVVVQTEAWSRRWAAASAWTWWRPGTGWRLAADGALALTASAGDAVWPEAPTAQVGVSMTYTPDRTLALSARAEAATASHSRAVRGDLPSRIPGGVVVDLSVRRSVWRDRLALALTGHNVFGAPEQPSALGARLGPRLHLRLLLRL